MRAVARRPAAVLGIVAVLALGGAVLALRLEPQTGVDTLVSGSSQTAKASDALQARLRRRPGGDPGQGPQGPRRPAAHAARTRPGPADQAGGLPVGQRARPGPEEPAAGLHRPEQAQAGQGGLRAGHLHQHRGQPDQRRAGGPPAGHQPAGRPGGRLHARRRGQAGRLPGPPAGAGAGGGQAGPGPVHPADPAAGAALRAHQPALAGQRGLRLHAGVRLQPRARWACPSRSSPTCSPAPPPP